MGRVVINGANFDFPEAFAAAAIKEGNVQNPSKAPYAIVPHDTNKLPSVPASIFVGGAGDIVLRGVNGAADVTFKAVPVGSTLNVQPEYIRATGTTATFLVGFDS